MFTSLGQPWELLATTFEYFLVCIVACHIISLYNRYSFVIHR